MTEAQKITDIHDTADHAREEMEGLIARSRAAQAQIANYTQTEVAGLLDLETVPRKSQSSPSRKRSSVITRANT